MRLPIDTSRLQFLVVSEAKEHRKYDEDKPKEQWEPQVDENGELLYRVSLVAMSDSQAEVIKVQVAGDPGLKQGELARCEGLTASAWQREKRSGVSFRADAIRAVGQRVAAAEKAAA